MTGQIPEGAQLLAAVDAYHHVCLTVAPAGPVRLPGARKATAEERQRWLRGDRRWPMAQQQPTRGKRGAR